MKIYLSWSPGPPDPMYWKWMSLDGIVVSVATLKKRRLLKKAILVGLHELLGFHGEIFLDSGSYEDVISEGRGEKLSPSTPEELLALAGWLRVNLVAHLDIPFIGEHARLPEEEKWLLLRQNIVNARIMYELSKQNNQTEVVYVIQGWSRESLAYCAQELARVKATYYAIGSLIGLQPYEIETRIKLVRGIIGDGPKLHLFAVSNTTVVGRVKSLINSIDSSTSGIAGAMKELIHPLGRMHIDKVDKELLECHCPACRQYKGAVLLLGKEGSQNYYNQLRKIHNAHQLCMKLRQTLAQNENSNEDL